MSGAVDVGNATPEEVTLPLGDGSEATLSTAAVTDRARQILSQASIEPRTPEEPGRVRALIDGHPFDVIPLVALTLGVETDALRLSPTVSALRRLGFEFEDSVPVEPRRGEDHERPDLSSNVAPSEAIPTQRLEDRDDHVESVSEEVVGPYMSADLANSLQRHAGKWVAIRDNVLVGHADTLRELKTLVGPGKVSVLFVPQPSPSTSE